MAKDPELRVHREWLGMLQPVGLVVSPPALSKGQAIPSKNVIDLQKRLLEVTTKEQILDFPRFATDILGWEADDLVGHGATEVPNTLEVALTEYHEVLSPTYAIAKPRSKDEWLMLVEVLNGDDKLDDAPDRDGRAWHASPQIRFERLLRETEVPLGLLCNAQEIRIVYAPSGESSGHLTFPVAAMCEVGGRPILAALHMLLSAERLFTVPTERRLPALLVDSRKYQNDVSTALSEQVLRALGELLRGFQVADDSVNGQLLGDTAREDPQHIYGGLISTLLRLVFLLYAEERDLIPGRATSDGDGVTDEHALGVYRQHYSVTGLFEKLRADAGLYPDTMDQRFGAWARLLSLFRLVFDGGAHGAMHLPARHGQLFNPDEYAFLEGRAYRINRVMGERIEPPRVPDGTVYRVLEDLLMLDGERLSYRSLDVEQIGSVYEAVMGFEVKRAFGPSIALRPQHVVVNLQEVLDAKAGQRAKKLKTDAGCDVPKSAAKGVKEATTVEDLVAALGKRISPQTPVALPAGSLYLQPTEERRRSGSHYTPRSLTEPIVRTTLRPILDDLGDQPTQDQILGLKVCDPAMGSGAFLVEACRHLADKLVQSWTVHDSMPEIPPDEDPILHARRLVAQRCLYGVDKNPFAVNLAKLSLWLVTLAKDHPFTFIDQSLMHGDSLVGLTRKQIATFHWKDQSDQDLPLFKWVAEQIGKAKLARADIFALGDEHEAQKRAHWREAEDALDEARMTGDLAISAFFSADKDKARETRRKELWEKVQAWRRGEGNEGELRGVIEDMREAERPVVPLHWEVEFPEVFDRENPGFDSFVGNPPFLGGARIWPVLGSAYCDFIRVLHPNSGGKAVDLVAHFLRRAFLLMRAGGTFGLIATNTVSQGDTREAGLREIRRRGGEIFSATRRLRWPGLAAVIVSQIHVYRGHCPTSPRLDAVPAAGINSHLIPRADEIETILLAANKGICFQGACVLGMGFTFDDADKKGVASSTETMRAVIEKDKRNLERILPYIGGREVNTDPRHLHHRFVIDFSDLSIKQASEWPDLIKLIRQRVKPERDKLGGYSVAERRREQWWQFGTVTPALNAAKAGLKSVLVASRHQHHLSIAQVTAGSVFAESLVVFALDGGAAFSVLQSHVHDFWARFFGSSMKDDLRYTPADCFETFPFPQGWSADPTLESLGTRYHEFRADLMLRNDEGLTKTYNRFHDPDETSTDIIKLRDVHGEMDRAVLDAYGWKDIKPTCEFLLDYEDDDEDGSSKRRKPWRYRWPDEVQEDVLARLLDLNQNRAEEERQAGLAAEKGKKNPRRKEGGRKKPATKKTRKKKVDPSQSQTALSFGEDGS